MNTTKEPFDISHIPTFVQGVNMNPKPETCALCEAEHEPHYPHQDTAAFRRHIFRTQGRVATQYDLLSHTNGVIRESAMVASLQSMEVR